MIKSFNNIIELLNKNDNCTNVNKLLLTVVGIESVLPISGVDFQAEFHKTKCNKWLQHAFTYVKFFR